MSGEQTSHALLSFEETIGERIATAVPVTGGDIGDSYRIELLSGDPVFLKIYDGEHIDMARAEAEGLAWLSEANALRVATVRDVGPSWLALDWIESAPPAADFAERLGEGLARLHAFDATDFGFPASNWIGRLPQRNRTASSWAEFYARERLEPLRRRALREGRLPAALASRLEALIGRLPELVGPEAAPARLHGDLWRGNVLSDEQGAPCLIDPAVYAGHREMDLAMMKLFGGFGAGVFEAYERESPLAPGADNRVDLYQVYPLLVHVCLFGDGYLGSLSAAIEAASQ